MDRNNMSTPIVLVILAGILMQVLLIFADSRPMPHRTAIAFSKAYFQLDPAMGNFLCTDLRGDEEADPVALLRERRFDEARERGFPSNMIRANLYHVDSRTELSEDGDQALVHITALRRTAINPVFAWVARLFSIGESHHLEETLELVKEEGTWKVCGNPFGLADLAT
ncbi:MAG TPA: hypothetical protein ENF48_11965 [Desulfobacteraceae bacterium]|nr:hypothetical protein [Deltaproteobacteria bacterium]MBW2356556.1 hypothetical protein [Deltaproteobacteria bacterium]RLB98251.1 MAG: hypothetical protein DRH76_03035 [Deltaproteobacteria bacterium]HDI61046.1 hypothetical protein [Desulfobacteraceae bacterium]